MQIQPQIVLAAPSPQQAVAEHYIMNHAEDPLYLPVMTYHLLQARVRLVEMPS